MVHLEALCSIYTEEARSELEQTENIQFSKEEEYSTQVTKVSSSDALSINRLCNNYGISVLLQFWLIANNVRFGRTFMAIKTAERLVQGQMY